jgi:predicted oxidoreductase
VAVKLAKYKQRKPDTTDNGDLCAVSSIFFQGAIMQQQQISATEICASRIAQGCMSIGGGWDSAPLSDAQRQLALRAIHAALEQGITFFDHADIYAIGKSEEAFSAIWSEVTGLRERIILQTKCGIRFQGAPTAASPSRYDFSAEHILESVDGSLRRLRTDYLDILLLHRPDPLVEPEEVAAAFSKLRDSGKVRYFGVSNHTPAQMALLQQALDVPLVVNQIEFNLLHADLLEAGVLANQSNPSRWVQGEGIIEYCRQQQITLQAWTPLAQGRLCGDTPPTEAHLQNAWQAVARLAQQKAVSKEAILLAWILRHPACIQPVIGTTNPQRIAGACQADQVELSREEWYALFVAARGGNMP